MARIKKSKRKYLTILLICLLTVVAGVVVYGKYYATRNNKGVVSASNIYFSSDKLKKSTGITDIDEIIANEDMLNKISVFTNSDSWSTVNLTLPFDVRNYDNNILYNEKNLDIKYKVEFVLLDDPVGASYRISSEDGRLYPLAQKGSKVVLESTLAGGTRKSNTFAVQVMMESQEDYEAARVLAMAYPVEPDYIYKDKADKQEYRLLGIFKGRITDIQMSIQNAAFKVQEKDKYSDTGWKALVEDLSGYIYNIKTIGDVVTDSQMTTKQQIKVTWNAKYLAIDIYNDYYLAVKKHDEEAKKAAIKAAEEAGKPTDDVVYDKYLLDNEDGTRTMIIDVLPYNSIDITFYRTEEFKSELSSQPANASGRMWFENLVVTEMNE